MSLVQNQSGRGQNQNTMMEIDGIPLYIKSDSRGIPYLYDVDTNEKIGYWCTKKCTYVMFSPYMQMINKMKRDTRSEMKKKAVEAEAAGVDDSDDEAAHEDEAVDVDDSDDEAAHEDEAADVDSDEESKNSLNKDISWSNYTIVKFFMLMLLYIVIQKQFQLIYVDFICLFTITILYNKIVTNVLDFDAVVDLVEDKNIIY